MAEPSFFGQLFEAASAVKRRVDETVSALGRWAESDEAANVAAFLDSVSIEVDVARYFEFTGWYVPRHPTLIVPLLEDQQEHRPFHPARLTGLFGPKSVHWAWIREGLLASPSVASRRKVVADALWALESERWAAGVSTLAPLIEGLLTDRTLDYRTTNVGAKLDALLDRPASEFETLAAIGVLQTVKREMYRARTFEAADIDDGRLHRHVILHGRSGQFGTEQNAVRLLSIIVALIETFDGPVADRAAAPPDDVVSLLQFAPLLRAQRAHAARQRSGLESE